MWLRSTLSILALYEHRPDIFDGFVLPEGIDRDTLYPELLAEVAELETLYTDPDVLKTLIEAWSKRRLYAWTKLYETTQYDYNPIWNKDGVIRETSTETRDLDVSGTEDRTGTATSTARSTGTSESEAESLHQVYGYNSAAAQNADRDTQTASSESTTNATSTDNTTGNVSTERGEDETITRTYERVEQGNIGVTTTQKMIEEERAVSDFDIYAYIIDDFKGRFCLLIY